MSSSTQETGRAAAREARRQIDVAGAETSLHTECMRFVESTEDGAHVLLLAVLFSEKWSRPPVEEIADHDAKLAYDTAMHHMVLADRSLAQAFKLAGNTTRAAFYAHRAETGHARHFWLSDACINEMHKN